MSTQKIYNYMLQRLFKHVKNIEDIESTHQYLDQLTPSVKKQSLMAILRYVRHNNYSNDIIDHYQKCASLASEQDQLERVKREATDTEKESFITWEDVIAKRDSLKDTMVLGKKSHLMYVILCLYTMLPPQRGQVFYNCYIDKYVDGSNVIDLERKKLVIREHKAKARYGTIEIDLNDELSDILKVWKPHSVKCRRILLPNKSGKEFNASTFNSLLRCIFNSKLAVDMLRKIYISHQLSKGISHEERRTLAHNMGHSVKTQEFYYKKKEFMKNS